MWTIVRATTATNLSKDAATGAWIGIGALARFDSRGYTREEGYRGGGLCALGS
jgi:hypothetical protein